MLPEIVTINNALCDVEQTYGVIFNRETAVIAVDNNYKVLHLLVDTYIQPYINPQEQIASTLAIIAPEDEVQICPIVTVSNLQQTAYTGVKVIDASGNQLQSSSIFQGPPVPVQGLSGGITLMAGPSIKNLNVTITQNPNGTTTFRASGTVDVSLFLGLITYDIFSFDIQLIFGSAQQ